MVLPPATIHHGLPRAAMCDPSNGALRSPSSSLLRSSLVIHPHTGLQNPFYSVRRAPYKGKMDLLIDAVYQQQAEGSQASPNSGSNTASSAPSTVTPPAQVPPSRAQLQPQSGLPHRCPLCARTYERADHLNRHLKSHENARPHKCSRCTKSFNRADLLNRHEASHDRHAKGDSRPRIERGDRVATACRACVTSKSKCQEQKPCARCLKRGIACESSAGSRNNRFSDFSSPLFKREALVGDGSGHAPSIVRSMGSGSQSGYESPYSDNVPTNVPGIQPRSVPNQMAGVVQGDMHTSGSSYYADSPPAGFNLDAPPETMGFLPDLSQFRYVQGSVKSTEMPWKVKHDLNYYFACFLGDSTFS